MLLSVISVLLLNFSEIYPSARFNLNIYNWFCRSAALLQSNLSSFPKTTHVWIASSIAVDLPAKLTQNIARSFVDKPPAESHGGCYNEEFICCSEWLACYSWRYIEVYSSTLLNFNIHHYISHWQHCWRATSLFQYLGGLNINQRRLEQDPGLGSPVGGLRRVFIKLEMIIF